MLRTQWVNPKTRATAGIASSAAFVTASSRFRVPENAGNGLSFSTNYSKLASSPNNAGSSMINIIFYGI